MEISQYYQLQERHHSRYNKDRDKIKHSLTWLQEDTVDSWRHNRMYKMIDPILAGDPGAKWLTVGDGRYGKEAMYIIKHHGKVVATDLSDALLKIAKQKGLIDSFKKENAEHLSFKDKSFDYCLCKESFHHFPRPTIALYEMLRVAKKAVILIEPHDTYNFIESYFVEKLRKNVGLSKIRGYFNSFEPSGNYVYKIAEREIEKTAIALGYKMLAFKGLDDYYLPGVENVTINEKSSLFRKIKGILFILDLLYKLKVRQRSLLCAMIFKEIPENNIRERLFNNGYKLIQLPENPYV
jgi:ubiquinone/menaquinone biosynthesis C-methylase UbiE